MANSVDTLALSPKAHGHLYAHDVHCTCIFTVVKLWQGECGDWRWRNDPLACLCSSVGGIPNFKNFRLWNPVLHEQYFGHYRDSVNVVTGDVGITSWPYFWVKLSYICLPYACINDKERKVKKRKGVSDLHPSLRWPKVTLW